MGWGMNLYKVLIVDDEEEIRQGIIKKIDWETYGFKIVGDAENGEDALEKAEKLQPDIVMTDIKMPFMNGLELGEKLKDLMPSTKIIIFSGSDDFEYAKKAIKINALGYVLKPINSMELIEVLKKLKKQIDEEYNEKKNIENLKKYYEESLPLFKEKFLVGAIEGRVKFKTWKEEAKKIGLEFDFPFNVIGVIHCDNYIGNEKDNIFEEEFKYISIKNICDDIIKDYCEYESFIYSGLVVVIGKLSSKEDVYKFIKGINEVCSRSERIMDMKVSAGIGNVCNDFEQIRFSYKEAKNALHYRIILGTGKGIYIEDVEPDNGVNIQFDENDERTLINTIKIKSSKDIEFIVNNLFKKLEELLLPFNHYNIYLIEITTGLLKLVKAYNLNIDEVFGENFNCYSHLEKFESIESVKKWFIEKSITINNLIKRERVDSSKLLIEKAKQYIHDNYSDSEISVENLCKHLHVSPTYFSTIFKKETKTSFVNYLTSVRLEQAVNLLNTTDYKSYIIAEKVGYPEANYFSYVFKKQYGVPPSKYRNR